MPSLNSWHRKRQKSGQVYCIVYQVRLTTAPRFVQLEDLSSEDLNRLLGHFFVSVRKKNGEEYEPATLTSFHRSIDRFLRDKGQTQSVLLDRAFEGARQALAAKRKDLRKQVKGRKPNAAKPLTEQEEEQLWKCGQLGGHSPHALNRTMWWLNTLHFGWRGRDEH